MRGPVVLSLFIAAAGPGLLYWDNYVRSMVAKVEARGEVKGKAEGIAFVAWRTLARVLSPNLTAESTGLPLDEVESLM